MSKITDILKENIMTYSSYLIEGRVLPSVEDSLKPVHRRILYTLYKNGGTKLTKSANVTGLVMQIHPHGDTYPTCVNMTQKDKQNIPLLVGKGNFAQHTSKDMKAAASRYTEIKLSDMSCDMLSGLNSNMVEYVPNYDNTKMIPKYLPVKFPAILAYTTSGIGVGISTTIPAFNINELCDASVKYIKEKKKTILYPDFATGAYIIKDEKAFANIIHNGKGTIRLRAKCTIKGNDITVTEIPYTTTREDIIDKVIDLIKNGKIKEIADIKDLTDFDGMRFKITCKRGQDPNIVLEKLYRLTPMESTFSANMNVLSEGKPCLLGFYDMVDKWYNFRASCITKYLSNEIKEMKKQLHLLTALKKVLLDIDKAVELIRHSKDPLKECMKYFEIDEVQAKYICGIKLQNINADHIIQQLKDVEKFEKELHQLQKNVEDSNYIQNEIVKGIQETKKKYNCVRKTQLIEPVDIKIEKQIEHKLIEDYDITLYLTQQGYFKKVRHNRGENKLKSGDEVMYELHANNKDEVIFYGEDKNVYKFKIHELSEDKLNTLGQYINNEIGCRTLAMSVISKDNKFVVIVYKDRVVKINMDCYKTTTNRKKLKNSLYSSELVKVFTLQKDEVLNLTTLKGKQKKIDTSELTEKMSRDSQGIKVLGKDEFII